MADQVKSKENLGRVRLFHVVNENGIADVDGSQSQSVVLGLVYFGEKHSGESG